MVSCSYDIREWPWYLATVAMMLSLQSVEERVFSAKCGEWFLWSVEVVPQSVEDGLHKIWRMVSAKCGKWFPQSAKSSFREVWRMASQSAECGLLKVQCGEWLFKLPREGSSARCGAWSLRHKVQNVISEECGGGHIWPSQLVRSMVSAKVLFHRVQWLLCNVCN